MTARERFMAVDYHLLKRRRQDGKAVYYVGFPADTLGKNGRPRYRALRSTGAGNKPLAHKIAREMIAKGEVFAARDDLRAFLLGFWNSETSEYLRSKRAEGHDLAVAYVDANVAAIKAHFLPYFEQRGKRTLADLDRSNLEAWRNWALLDEKIPPRTVNRTRQVVWTALQWAVDHDLLPFHPGQGVKRVPEKAPERRIFELEELGKLFAVPWDDLRAYMLAASCGLRLGEVLGLQVGNVHLDQGYLDVLTGWTRTEGLKGPKWGSERVGVPVPARAAEAVKAVLATHR